MSLIYDIHPRKTGHEQTKILHEIFDTTHDVIDWAKKEEKKIEKRHKSLKKIKGVLHFLLLTSIIFT